MSTSGSTFTDWQQLEDDRPLLIDDDFSWSDLPARRRRRSPEPAPARRAAPTEDAQAEARRTEADFERARDRWSASYEQDRRDLASRSASRPANRPVLGPEPPRPVLDPEPPRPVLDPEPPRPARASESLRPLLASEPTRLPGFDPDMDSFDRDDAASYATARVLEDRSGALDLRHSGRRTVIITGRGDSRYTIAPARRRSSELGFHERTVFNPDRTAKWAVLLGIALLIGCIAH